MNVYVICRSESASWGQIKKLYIVARDEKHAERLARMADFDDDLHKAHLSVHQVDTDKEHIFGYDTVEESERWEPI